MTHILVRSRDYFKPGSEKPANIVVNVADIKLITPEVYISGICVACRVILHDNTVLHVDHGINDLVKMLSDI